MIFVNFGGDSGRRVLAGVQAGRRFRDVVEEMVALRQLGELRALWGINHRALLEGHPDAQPPKSAWYERVRAMRWEVLADVYRLLRHDGARAARCARRAKS